MRRLNAGGLCFFPQSPNGRFDMRLKRMMIPVCVALYLGGGWSDSLVRAQGQAVPGGSITNDHLYEHDSLLRNHAMLSIPVVQPVSSGDLPESTEVSAGLLRFARREQNALWQRYLYDLQAIGWNSVSRFRQVSDRSDLNESLKIAQRTLEIAIQFEGDFWDPSETVLWQITMLDIPSSEKDQIYSQFRTEFHAESALTWEWFETEFALIESVLKALDFLERYRTSWVYQDGQITFNDSQRGVEFERLELKSQAWRERRIALDQQLAEALNAEGSRGRLDQRQ